MTVLKYWNGTEWVPAVVGRPGAPGESFANIDGGKPDSNYGGVENIDCGGPA